MMHLRLSHEAREDLNEIWDCSETHWGAEQVDRHIALLRRLFRAELNEFVYSVLTHKLNTGAAYNLSRKTGKSLNEKRADKISSSCVA